MCILCYVQLVRIKHVLWVDAKVFVWNGVRNSEAQKF